MLEIDKQIIAVKKVQGEIPLNGLTKRLSYAIERVENLKQGYEDESDSKVLKIGTNKEVQ